MARSADQDALRRAAAIVVEADAVLIAAGAGMSVDSGLPTYSTPEGLYRDYPPYRGLGLDYRQLTSPSCFRQDPTLAWGFFGHCLNLYRDAHPHEGYEILKRLALAKPSGWFVVTTNVDGQFLKAGFDPDRVHEVHGSRFRLQCLHPCRRETWSSDGVDVEVDPVTMGARPPLPTCPWCSAPARPNVYLFGDTDEQYVWEASQGTAERLRTWVEGSEWQSLAVVEIGAGAPGLRLHSEEYARTLPRAQLVRINPNESEVAAGLGIGIALGARDAIRDLGAAP